MAFILFADDDPAAVEIAAEWLRQEGHQAEVVHDGRQAMERVRQTAPDILVTDLMMPFHDGFEVIAELCRLYPEKHIPVILLAALGADGQPLRMRSSGPVSICITRGGDAAAMSREIIRSLDQLLHARHPA